MGKLTPRSAVITILDEVFGKDVFFQEAFQKCLDAQPDNAPHRAYIFRLSKGVTERHVTLLAILGRLSSTPVEKIRPALRCILLTGLYELSYMDTPEHAVVNESVKLAESMGFGRLKGFVNGILRTYLREGETIRASLRISERLGLPDELFLLLKRCYGLETTKIIAEAFFREERLTVRRLDSRIGEKEFSERLAQEGIKAEKSGILEQAFYFPGRPEESSVFREGLCYAQDLSSMLDGELGSRVLKGDGPFDILDSCAAPGGKTIDLLDGLNGRIRRFVSCDISESKLSLLRENLSRTGFPEAKILLADAALPEEAFREAFDLVVADVPCSGIGIIGRKPDIRRHINREALGELEALQRRILRNVSAYVRPGGFLIYSTCTLNPGENRRQISDFLNEEPAFRELDVHPLLPEAYRAALSFPGLPAGKDLTVIPGLHPSDGFYICLLQKMV